MAVERTLVILKPDAHQRKVAGKIYAEYIAPLKLDVLAWDLIEGPSDSLSQKVALHYNKDDAWCLKWGTKKRDLMAPGWDHEIRGALPSNIEFGHAIRTQLYESISAAPVIAFVLSGENAVDRVRALVGATDPIAAAEGTIRGNLRERHINLSAPALSEDESIAYAQKHERAVRNLVHASDSVEEAVREIGIWFPDLD